MEETGLSESKGESQMIRKPKQMSESMILGVVLTLAGAGFRQRADWKHCPAGPKYRQRQLSKRPPLPVPPAGFFSRGIPKRMGPGAV